MQAAGLAKAYQVLFTAAATNPTKPLMFDQYLGGANDLSADQVSRLQHAKATLPAWGTPARCTQKPISIPDHFGHTLAVIEKADSRRFKHTLRPEQALSLAHGLADAMRNANAPPRRTNR